MSVYEIIRIVGVGIIIYAYFALLAGHLKSRSVIYPLLNIAGIFLIIYPVFGNFNVKHYIPEILWMIVSFYGLWRAVKR